MPHEFLHQHREFADLLRIVGIERSVAPVLNEAFLLSDPATRAIYADAYARSRTLYHAPKPNFATIIETLAKAATIEGI